MSKIKYLFFILVLGFILRVTFLGQSLLLPDEPAYIVRSFGWIDTLLSQVQTTPVDWFKNLPWWTSLSFHDHPPLTFFVNHIFMNLGGFGLFFGRLGSALFGVASILWLYGIGKKILNREAVLFSTALFATNCLVVFFDRSAMMEAVSNFFILGTAWFFLKSDENKKYLLGFFSFLSLSILAKYVALFLLPAYFVLILIYRRDWLKEKIFYTAIFLFFIILSPILIYNFNLYKFTNHFDVQFATLFNQNTPEWSILLGKDQRNDILFRFKSILFLNNYTSMVFVLLTLFSAISTGFYFINLIKTKTKLTLNKSFLYLMVATNFIFLLYVGIMGRFFYYIIPWLCLLIAEHLSNFITVFRLPKRVIFLSILILEGLVTINIVFGALFFNKPLGYANIIYPTAATESDYGEEKLRKYLDSELKNFYSSNPKTFDQLPRLNRIINNDILLKQKNNGFPLNAKILYDQRLDFTALFWSIAPSTLFQGWPAISDHIFFVNYVREKYASTTLFYIVLDGKNPHREDGNNISGVFRRDLVKQLNGANIPSTTIFNNLNEPMFSVFKILPDQLPPKFLNGNLNPSDASVSDANKAKKVK